TVLYPLSLHDALPICLLDERLDFRRANRVLRTVLERAVAGEEGGAVTDGGTLPDQRDDDEVVFLGLLADGLDGVEDVVLRGRLRSEEHTSELQSRSDL